MWLPLLDHRPAAGASPVPMYLGVLEALVETCMDCVDNMVFAGLIHLSENTFEDPRNHGAADLLSVRMAQPITTTATGTTFMGRARYSAPAMPSATEHDAEVGEQVQSRKNFRMHLRRFGSVLRTWGAREHGIGL